MYIAMPMIAVSKPLGVCFPPVPREVAGRFLVLVFAATLNEMALRSVLLFE